MKNNVLLALTIGSLLFTACEALGRGPEVVWTAAKTNGKEVTLQTTKLDGHTFQIVVYSKDGLTEKQLFDVWFAKADKLAAGRPYQRQANIEPWEYEGGGLVGEQARRYVGTKMTGRIVLN